MKKLNLKTAVLGVSILGATIAILFILTTLWNHKQEANGIDTSSKEASIVTKELLQYKTKANENIVPTEGTLSSLLEELPKFLMTTKEIGLHVSKALTNKQYLESDSWKSVLLELTAESQAKLESLSYTGDDYGVESKLNELKEEYPKFEKVIIKLLVENEDEFILDLFTTEFENMGTLSNELVEEIAKNYS